jgi:hypothetical protein
MVCKYIEKCNFFRTFSTKQSFVWKAMIKNYCELGEECVRRNSSEVEGIKNVPAELMPSGTYASKAFLSLL